MLTDRLTAWFQTLAFRPADFSTLPPRRADIDWLRIALFGLLILHHVGMFYVLNWDWHAKSTYRAQWLESVLLVVEPWRMPAIWLISGIAIRYVLARVNLSRYIALRTLRLLLPLLFGVWVVVPPQLFVEMSAKGEISMGYWPFLQAFVQSDHPLFANYSWGIWPHIDVNHLWYLRSLWYYSMWMIPLLPLLNHVTVQRLISWLFIRHGILILVVLCLPIVVLQIFWKVNDIRYPIGFLFLLYGYLLGWQEQAWQRIKSSLGKLSLTYALVSGVFIASYNLLWIDSMQGAELALGFQLPVLLSYSVARILGVAMVLSLACNWFNRPNSALVYFNEAVYPFYILHQSIILVVGYSLSSWQLGPVVEPLLLITLTIMLCFGLFELIRRTDVLRPFFGLTLRGNYSRPLQRMGYFAGGILIAPMLWALVF